MVGKVVKSKIAWYKQRDLAARALHFYSSIIKFIKSGNKESLRNLGELISC